eukprot:2306682-Rhodomonas_salina.1
MSPLAFRAGGSHVSRRALQARHTRGGQGLVQQAVEELWQEQERQLCMAARGNLTLGSAMSASVKSCSAAPVTTVSWLACTGTGMLSLLCSV